MNSYLNLLSERAYETAACFDIFLLFRRVGGEGLKLQRGSPVCHGVLRLRFARWPAYAPLRMTSGRNYQTCLRRSLISWVFCGWWMGGSAKATPPAECGMSSARRAEVGEFARAVCWESGQFLTVNQGQSNLIKAKRWVDWFERYFGTRGWRISSCVNSARSNLIFWSV
jgi:hypothetical protein